MVFFLMVVCFWKKVMFFLILFGVMVRVRYLVGLFGWVFGKLMSMGWLVGIIMDLFGKKLKVD